MGEGDEVFTGQKPHRKAHKGRKADKKDKGKGKVQEGIDPRIRNPKAFAINSVVRAERKFRRAQDLETKKDRVPLVDRTPVEAPPFIVAIVGPPKVGKSTLLLNLIKNYTRQNLTDIKGPVTIVTGKKRRLTIIECNNDINSMIDVAKVADLCLLLVDASFGFEMEVFEFLNICQVHGFPQIMGVLTHLDLFRNKKKLKKTKKTLKHRFWTEVYPGAKLFYLSGYFPMTNTYPRNEVHNLARFISVMKFRSTVWRSEHAYIVADRMEDLTSLEQVRVNSKVDRRISLYGWVHGTYLKQHVSVHIPGLGDFTPDTIAALPDPCPLPIKDRTLRRSLNEKEKVIYAPFSGVGGMVYDQDAVYIDLGGSHSHNRVTENTAEAGADESNQVSFIGELRNIKSTIDEKMESAGLKLFSHSDGITAADVMDEQEGKYDDDEQEEDDEKQEEDDEENNSGQQKLPQNFESVVAKDGRVRRKVIFDDEESHLKANTRDDDVTDSISKEIRDLKKSSKSKQNTNVNEYEQTLEDNLDGNVSYDSEDEGEEEGSDDKDDSGDSEEELQDKMAPSRTTKSASSTSKGVPKNTETLTSLVKKLKSKLKSKDSVIDDHKQSKRNENVKNHDKVQFEDDSDSGKDEDDDIDDSNEEDMMDSDEGESDAQQDSDEDSEPGSESEMVPKTSKILEKALQFEKQQRYSLAEEGFYSRFRNRSIQKMIYDDTEDYMNVTSRADFDLANFKLEAAPDQMPGVVEAEDEDMKELFIGGDYAETAKRLLDANDNADSEEDVFGDFEALDEDENQDTKMDNMDEGGPGNEEMSPKKREELKKKLKEKFDMEYDNGDDEKSFYKEWKSQVDEQTKINKTFFEDVDDENFLRDLQGLAPGSYVRIELSRIPCEFVTNFEPQRSCPLVVGSLDSPNQETLAVVQARVKKHRWHPKILKTRDPLIMSIGWRRFQTIALYSVQDHNMRNRMIKYTPDHLHCIANFYGPMTPQGTGILGIAPTGFDGFRITLTGTILDMDKSSELVKKLKLVGTPSKIFKKSAFIEGMFSSQLEVAKFVGAKIKTVSGIRGVIKKELRTPIGGFRATFEDKIVQSDIVFCRTWARVDVPNFYLNLPTLITSQPRLMKTVGQLKRERQIQIEPNPDNLYTMIERQPKKFRPLKIPKSLQAKLPYKDKPKVLAKLNEPKRIAVIKDPHERQMSKFLNTLKTRMTDREAKEKAEKAKKAGEREKMLKKVEERQNHRQKELRKKVFRTLGLMNKKSENPHGGGRRPPKHKRK